jgi:hypothetical protein
MRYVALFAARNRAVQITLDVPTQAGRCAAGPDRAAVGLG